ncbi:MAG: sugar transferase [Aggregatilineales bacterium]
MQAEKVKQGKFAPLETNNKTRASFSYPSSHRGPNYALISIALDIVGTIAAFLLVDLILQSLNIISVSQLQPILLISPLVIWPAAFFAFGIYDTSRNYTIQEESKKTILAVGLSMLMVMSILYLSYITIPRSLIVSLFAFDVVFLVAWRVFARFGASTRRASKPQRILIIGANDLGKQIEDIIYRTPWSQLEIFGYIDNTRTGSFGDLPIVGTYKEVRRLVEMHGIEEVVVALPHNQFEELNTIVMDLQSLPVQVRVVPSYLSLALYRATVDDLGGLPLINLRGPALTAYQRIFKRAFDLFVSGLILVLILPVIAAISVAIKLDSPGPIFFKQLRVGENGRMFKMYKFRSMVVNAEALQSKVNQIDADGNIVHKTRNDPRVTRIGRLIRKTSLDELPQFINVIRGDMSLVGPRPELPWLVEKYEPWQRQRFTVPQGITGWWQVNGRSDKPCHLNTDQDLYYIENYSFLLDIVILIKTIPALFKGKGAF